MEVALLTIGDEILAGDTVNTNASWLAAEIGEHGGSVRRILTVPDDETVIAEFVREWCTAFDAVVVTGGLGGTPDDVTMAAVANALDRELVVDEDVRRRLREKARRFAEENPDLTDEYDFDFDFDAASALPEDGRPLVTDAGWAPGCVVDDVYVLPGIPREMKAMFALVSDEFVGDVVAETLYTPTPEGALGDVLSGVRERFDVSVGSHPGRDDDPGRLRVTATNRSELSAAVSWLRSRVETVERSEAEDG